MNNSSILATILVIVALVTGGYWFYTTNNAAQPEVAGEDRSAEQASVGQTFAQLMGMGQSLECTYEYNDGTNVSSGVVYIADGGERIRGDFTFTQSDAGPMEMHMLRADGYNHMWGSAMPQGIKTQVTAENRAQLFDNTQSAAVNENTQYKCTAWTVNEGTFTLPAGVQFMDIGDVTKMMGAPKIGEANIQGSTGGDIKAMQCAACDQAGPARDQCRQALGCK